jgi:hypothetical protein
MKSIIVHTHSCLCQHIPKEYWYRNLKSGLWLHTQYTRVSFLRIRAHSTVHVSKQTKIIYLNKHDKVKRAIVCKAQNRHPFKLCKPLLRPYQGHKASDKRNERIRCNSSAFTLSGTIAAPVHRYNFRAEWLTSIFLVPHQKKEEQFQHSCSSRQGKS